MSISLPPAPAAPKKKSGCGCLGCGCGAILLILVLLVGLFVAGIYSTYQMMAAHSSTDQGNIPAFSGDSSVLDGAQKKLAAFQHDAIYHQKSSLHLNSDEINALIANSPDLEKKHIRVFVTMTNDIARVQASLPGDMIYGLYPGRYFNFDANLAVTFDTGTKMIQLMPHSLSVGDTPILEEGATSGNTATTTYLHAIMPALDQSFNTSLRANSGVPDVLDHARNVAVKDGELVIETE